MSEQSIQNAREHCWDYFSLHAQQRISVFQYFITIETALITASIISLQYKAELNSSSWAIIMGPAIILFSFVFWKIDQRTRDLIKKAENSLREIEKLMKMDTLIHLDFPFSEDPQHDPNVKFSTFPLIPGRLSYSKSFGVIYVTSSIFGAVLTFAMAKAFFCF